MHKLKYKHKQRIPLQRSMSRVKSMNNYLFGWKHPLPTPPPVWAFLRALRPMCIYPYNSVYNFFKPTSQYENSNVTIPIRISENVRNHFYFAENF